MSKNLYATLKPNSSWNWIQKEECICLRFPSPCVLRKAVFISGHGFHPCLPATPQMAFCLRTAASEWEQEEANQGSSCSLNHNPLWISLWKNHRKITIRAEIYSLKLPLQLLPKGLTSMVVEVQLWAKNCNLQLWAKKFCCHRLRKSLSLWLVRSTGLDGYNFTACTKLPLIGSRGFPCISPWIKTSQSGLLENLT